MPLSLPDRLTARLISTGLDETESRNARRHVGALTLSKLADGLVDPKLILSWLLGSLGAPAAFVALLVPIREAGALLPQLVIGAWIGRLRYRRLVWAGGSAFQGAAAGGIALVALMASGWLAGALICALLAVLALARAACSVSYKDVLGKTIEQSRRGKVTGLAGSVSAALVVVFAGLLIAGALRSEAAVIAAIALAALAWSAAAVIFAGIDEAAGRSENITSSGGYLAILREDANLRRFILVRGLLVSTALAPPFFVLLATEGAGLNRLGAMLLAASLAAFLGSYFWGRLADRDSRHVMLGAGCLGAAAMAVAILLHVAGKAGGIPVALFVLMLGWNGVKQARTIYLVDISDADLRARNTALANTAIGMILLLAGLLGGALSVLGPVAALAGFAVMALAGGLLALTLRPVDGAR
jgi:hypothetical protein